MEGNPRTRRYDRDFRVRGRNPKKNTPKKNSEEVRGYQLGGAKGRKLRSKL